MRNFIQGVCVFAFALGAGLFAFGTYLQPELNFTNVNPVEFTRFFDHMNEYRIGASIARGFGIGFMTLGGLGLIVPWVNVLLTRERSRVVATPPGAGPSV
ncbi:MAG TPA: hypothetical protein VGP68_20150 [Gemmataceae bacterium]|nr:hypothetical protein [Gemmataceae bacterium]